MGNSLSSGTIEINNFEELLEFAEAGVKPGQKQLKLSPELGVLVIHVEGEGYGNFIPGEQLRSLWQIQEDFFRLAAYALHRAPPGSQGRQALCTECGRFFRDWADAIFPMD